MPKVGGDQLTRLERRVYLVACYFGLALTFCMAYVASRIADSYLPYINVLGFLALGVCSVFGYAAKRDIRVLDLRRVSRK